jgi:Zn-dependent protease
LNSILVPVASLLALVLGITIHEFSHAFSADLLGDSTARRMGRMTLNPVAHFDPLGGLMILVSSLSGFGFGWGKPVPVNPLYLRYGPRVGMGITSFAGPFSNIVLATLFAAPMRIASTRGVIMPAAAWVLLGTVVSTNVALAVFNLLPIYPLDGFSVLRGILSTVRARWAYDLSDLMDRMLSLGPMIFMGLLLVDRMLPGRGIIWTILGPAYDLLMRLILGVPS